MADQKQTVVLEFEVDESEAIESINSLTAANKKLRQERNELNISTEAGKKRATELNAVIDQNTAKIKNNVSAIEQQKINIGNYKSALDGVHPALGKVGQGLEAGTSGLKAMTMQALRFIATPIGAILAALVAVFSLLKAAISSNNDLMDKFENITNAVGIVLEIIVNRVGKLGEALLMLAQGDLVGAFNKTKEAVTGLGEEMSKAVTEGQRLLDMSRDLEDAQRDLAVATAKQENEIRRLVVASKNRNLTLDESEAKLREALKLEQELVAERERLAMQDLEITAGKVANTEKIIRKAGQSIEDFANELRKNSTLTDDQVDPIIEKLVALENARGGSLAFQEKVENQLSAIADKRAEAIKKQTEALKEQAEQERALKRAQSGGELEDKGTSPIEADLAVAKSRIDINKMMNDTIEKTNKEASDNEKRRIEGVAEMHKIAEEQKLQAAMAVSGALMGLLDEQSASYKAIATAQTLISTYTTATKAYEAAFLPIPTVASPAVGAAFAAAAVLQGLTNVARINGVEFADGGWTGPGSKYQVAGVVHADEYVVPKSLVNSPMGPAHISALEGMRMRGYADGGYVTSSISGPVNQAFEAANIMKNMPEMVVSVKEIETVRRRVKAKQNISKI